MPKLLALILLFIFLIFPKNIFAAFTFSSDKTQIDDNEELTVQINLDLSTQSASKTYYLRGAFFKDGSTKYFGYTINNNGDPYNGPYSSCQNLYKVITDEEGNWTGSFNVKPDPQSSYFEGQGQYLFKVGRYTENCNLTWAESTPLEIEVKTISPPPSDSPQILSSTPTTQPKTSAKSPSPSPKVSPKTASVLGTSKETSQSSTLSALLTESSPTPITETEATQSNTKIAGILTGGGLILVGLSILSYFWYKRRSKGKDENQTESEP